MIASTAITFVASLDSVATSDSAEMGGSGDSTAVVDASDTSYSGAGGSRSPGSRCSGLEVQCSQDILLCPCSLTHLPCLRKHVEYVLCLIIASKKLTRHSQTHHKDSTARPSYCLVDRDKTASL
jgi:hypothetical protein